MAKKSKNNEGIEDAKSGAICGIDAQITTAKQKHASNSEAFAKLIEQRKKLEEQIDYIITKQERLEVEVAELIRLRKMIKGA